VETRQLGNSDFQITTIGFGAWAIGGGNWEFGWGPQDDQESIAAIHRALDMGINWIDTAAAYGLGHSEEVVARALRGVSNRPYVFTKCSIVWGKERLTSHNLKAESLRREVEDSLRRLQVDVIDLYQIHWPDPDPDIEEGWRTLAELKAQGKVRYIGVSNFSVEQMERIAPIAPITSLQPPYSLLDRKIEPDILPYCQAHNIGVIVYSPMASGLLSGAMTRERIANFPQDDWRRNNDWFKEPQLTRNLELVEVLRRIGQRYGVTPGTVAVAWTLRHPAVTAAIVGARRPGQVVDIVPAADLKLSQDDVAEIEQFMRAKV
jgi:aryl-alcohol dehydrogenase-like predicted oxidoreductase